MSDTARKPVERKMLDKIHDDVEFYQHQVDGIRQMANMSSVILADDMGLGKSLQALTTAAIDFQRGWASHILIVCPTYLKDNWAEEIMLHTSFTFMVYKGNPKERTELRKTFNHDILICGYESLRDDLIVEQYARDGLKFMPWDILIVDEAHMVKERTSKRTKAVHDLPIKRVFLLTGSPVLNRPNELWSLLHRCDPTQFRSYWPFVQRYCVFGGFKSKQIVGTKNKIELRAKLSTFLIRRLKEDCLDLPGKSVIPIFISMGDYERKIYNDADADLKIVRPDGLSPMEIENELTKMLRLKQIAATPFCVGLEDKSVKLDKCMEMLEDFCLGENPEPVVVFTQFRGVMDAMRLRCDAAGIPLWQIHGDIKNDRRIPMTREWAESSQPGVLMVMLQMATGMNLTAASKEIFIDKLYVPKLNEQAEDRCYRIGQTKKVMVYCLISKGTVEERIERILKSKRHMFKTLIEDVSAWKELLLKEMREEADDEH